ncbi:MAG: hypothetical protein U0K91_05160 [Acutalibacteraceae bacterium]|nr:hypothetical protein [Acutalibacteraceae bacterium]
MAEKIILWGAVIGALVTIVTACLKVIKVAIQFDEWKKAEERHTKENYLDIKRLVITSPYMPIHERLDAGEKYIKAGGNGEVKKLYHALLESIDVNDNV